MSASQSLGGLQVGSLVDAVAGVIYGTAIGDALGFQVEFDSTVTPVNRKVSGMGPGQRYSDDTQMMRATLEGLLRAKTWSDVDKSAVEIAAEYVAWSKSPENNRAPGGTCMRACANLGQGIPWTRSGVRNSKGCGAPMKAMAYSVWHYGVATRAATWAAEHATMTHDHPAARAASAALAGGVAMAMERPLIRRNTIALKMEDFADEYDKGTGQMLYEAMVSEQRSAEEVLDKWRGWVADEAVAAALWCFLNTNNLRDALLLAANSPGDSDSIACMTGALAGAYYGVNQMPVVWLQCVEKTGELEVLAHRVVEALQGRV